MSNSTVPTDPPVSNYLLLLTGPLLVGSLMSSVLFGISIIQLYLYNIKFSNDRFMIQFSVYMVYALEVFLTVTAWALVWHVLCSGWGRFSNFAFPGWTFTALPIGTGILSAWIQIFYAWRIHMMVYWRVIPIVIIIIALVQTGAALAVGITVEQYKPIKKISTLKDLFPKEIVWLGGAALADVIISISMVYILYSAKKRIFAGGHTERAVNRLIRSTVETGITTSVCAVLELGLILGLKYSTLHIAFLLILSKLYTNTLMTSLNSRRTGSFGNQDTFGIVTTSEGFAHGNTDNTSTGIHVSTDVEVSDPHFQPKKQVE